MSLIIDGTTIPTNNALSFEENAVEKIICDGVEVWTKVVPITPPAASVTDYITISGSTYSDWHADCHQNTAITLVSDIWYAKNDVVTCDRTWTLVPKDPYTKISCTLHGQTYNILDAPYGSAELWVGGVRKISREGNVTLNINNASSITIRAKVWGAHPDHWASRLWCCVYNVTLS